MVNAYQPFVTMTAAWLAPLVAVTDETTQPLLWRLDPRQRASVLMAILGVVLVGIVLVALAILGGRYVMRLARKRSRPTPSADELWYRKPLVPAEPDDRPN